MASLGVNLTPGQTQQPQTGWHVQTADCNNSGSNCWLIYNATGAVIADPGQHTVVAIPGDAAPSFTLTATAPVNQQSQPNPMGVCYITLYDTALPPHPGVGSGISVLNNQILLAGPITDSSTHLIPVPPWVASIRILNGGTSSSWRVVGVPSTVTYMPQGGGPLTVAIPGQAYLDCDVSPQLDTAVNIFGGAGTIKYWVVGLPAPTVIAAENILANGATAAQDYLFAASGQSVAAADRALDSWRQVAGHTGGAINLSQAAPGIGLSLVITAVIARLTASAAVQSINRLQVGYTGTINAFLDTDLSVNTLGIDASLSLTDLRWLVPANTAALASVPAAGVGDLISLAIHGFTVSTPNA